MKAPSLFCVLALAASAACGEVASPKADAGAGQDAMVVPPADFELSLGSTSAMSLISGEVEVSVNIARGEGFTDAVALTASGMPAGVTTAFAASSLPDGTNTTDLKLTIGTSAEPGTTDIVVTGTAGSIVHTATLSLELETQTVSGTVRGNRTNVTVRLVGKNAVQSDGSGNFTFTDVKVPYDIYVIGQTGTVLSATPAVTYYKGLTRTDPTITQPSASGLIVAFQSSTATINGAMTGAGNTTSPLVFQWSTGGTATTAVNDVGGFSHTARWSPKAASKAGTLFGLQWTRGGRQEPNAYLGYGSTNATLSEGGTHSLTVNMVAPTTAALTGTITPPSGFPNPVVSLHQQLGAPSHQLWSATTTNASCLIPVIAAGKSSLHAVASSGSRTSAVVFPALGAATDVTFSLPAPAGVTGPVNSATNVTNSTPFEWTTAANQIYLASFRSAAATYFVYTTSGSITIPSVSEMPLPSATSFTWSVDGYGPQSNINAAADPVALESVSPADFDGPMHTFTSTPDRTFTTQ